MSGPKSFSVKIFDKELVQIFQMQCEVEEMFAALESAVEGKNPQTTSTAEQPSVAELKTRVSNAIKPFSFGTVHTIAAQNKERYDRLIAVRKGILKKLILFGKFFSNAINGR